MEEPFLKKNRFCTLWLPAPHGKSFFTFNNRAGFRIIAPLFQVIVPEFNLLRRILNNCARFRIFKPLLK
jgi:hypothetical protein